jgi:hypothetical protein
MDMIGGRDFDNFIFIATIRIHLRQFKLAISLNKTSSMATIKFKRTIEKSKENKKQHPLLEDCTKDG